MQLNTLKTKEEFTELFELLSEKIYRYAYIRCGYNKDLAQDITQEVFF